MQGLRQVGTIWLDVTRLVTRAGRGVLTGVDRVELAYLRHLLDLGAPATRYLVRSTRGYLLLDARGGALLADLAEGRVLPGRADLMSRMLGKGSDLRHRVESALRPLAVDRCLPSGLPRMLRRAGGVGVYLNTGHANLSEATLAAAARHRVRVVVLIHDLIPLTHPDLVAEGMTARFAAILDRVRRHAGLVICNSAATAADLAGQWQGGGPPRVVAPLGVTPPPPRAALPRDPRHFVMLGTIEPRKNHALMLEVWERLAAELPPAAMPHLHIIGPTGWRVEGLMARLADHPLRGRSIHLHGPLPDAAVQDHLARAVALLFPSIAEGYGYPPLEAAAAGALPICSDLSVFRETIGNCAVYLKIAEAYPWYDVIGKHVLGTNTLPPPQAPDLPRWAAHFDTAGVAIGRYRAEGP